MKIYYCFIPNSIVKDYSLDCVHKDLRIERFKRNSTRYLLAVYIDNKIWYLFLTDSDVLKFNMREHAMEYQDMHSALGKVYPFTIVCEKDSYTINNFKERIE